jgi:hypothetical protein
VKFTGTRRRHGSDGPRRQEAVRHRSKSERQAVVFRTHEGGEYVLRRQGGLAYDDPDLDKLVGTPLRCRSTLSGYTFPMTDCTEIPDEL